MPEANTDNANNDGATDSPKEVSGVPPTLDQVHQISQAKLEEEDANASATNSDDDADGTDGAADDDASVVDDDSGAGNDAAVDDGSDAADDGTGSNDDASGSGDQTPAPVAPVVEDKPAVDLNTDITKNADGKIAVRGADGKTFYFNNREEVPDDFEPASYKELMNASTAFAKKEQSDEAAAASEAEKQQTEAQKAENDARVAAMQQGWETDIKSFVADGTFPKDQKKMEAAATEVYDYIEAEMKKGNVLTSFKQAYKGMMFDKREAEAAEQQKKADEDKKKRGGVVQSGTGGNQPAPAGPRGNRVIEAPPVGAGLDAVHRRAVEQLDA